MQCTGKNVVKNEVITWVFFWGGGGLHKRISVARDRDTPTLRYRAPKYQRIFGGGILESVLEDIFEISNRWTIFHPYTVQKSAKFRKIYKSIRNTAWATALTSKVVVLIGLHQLHH